jgi:hypothetical protein
MPTRRLTLAALLLVPIALAGCKIETINYFPPKPAHVRAVNVMAGAPTLDMSAGDEPTWPAVAFEGTTDFVDLDNEQTTLAAKLPSAASPLVSADYSLAGEQTYSLVAYGSTSAPQLMLMPDANLEPGSGRTQLRLAQAATGIGVVDVYLTAPDLPLDGLLPNLVGVSYGAATPYLQFSPGTYRVRVTGSGTATVIYDSGARSFSDNTSTDMILYARTSGRLPSALLIDVNGAGRRLVAENTLAQTKFVHAAPQSGNVNVLIDSTAVFNAVPYVGATLYATVTAAAHAITLEAAATPGAPLASVTPTFAPASDTTIVLTGLVGSTRALVLADDNVPPPSGVSRVRFVNASIGAGPLDLLIDNVKRASAVAENAASAYVDIPAGTYTVAFADPATGTVRATLSPAVDFLDGYTTSVYAIGTFDALTGVATRDD